MYTRLILMEWQRYITNLEETIGESSPFSLNTKALSTVKAALAFMGGIFSTEL